MKHFIVSLIVVLASLRAYCQIPEKSKEVRKIERGFIYYINPQNLSFVVPKVNTSAIDLNDFTSKKLRQAYQIQWMGISLDTLEKHASKYKVLNYFDNDSAYLKVIIVEVDYTIFEYQMSRRQIRNSITYDVFDLGDKKLKIKSIGGIPININKITSVPSVNLKYKTD